MRSVDQRTRNQEQGRHKQEDGKHAEDNRLDQHKAHILTDLDLHEGKRQQAGDGRQAGSRNLGDRHAQRLDNSSFCF